MAVAITCCMLSVPYAYDKLDADELAQQIVRNTQPVAVSPFEQMRFFRVGNTLSQESGFWEKIFTSHEEQHQRALAMYLFNMYVSTQTYRQTPSILTLNYLGVLDGLVRGDKVFDTIQATQFYQKNKKQIDALLQQFMKNTPNKKIAPTQNQLKQWLSLLEKQPRHFNKPVYVFPSNNLLKATISPEIEKLFKPVLEESATQSQKKVIVYDEADVTLEDLDYKVGNYQARRKRTYRWVKDECYYTSYLIGRSIASQVGKHQFAWNTRVYVFTALPNGEFLVPAKGDRFHLANEQNSLHWRYHTAILVVVPQEEVYTPVVLDLFLGGKTPLSLDQWMAFFNRDTVFSAIPFERNRIVEEALKIPQKQEGTGVWVKDTRYELAPVEK